MQVFEICTEDSSYRAKDLSQLCVLSNNLLQLYIYQYLEANLK